MAGQYFDAETGLHYNYHRYYDPSVGRYIRPDPIGLDGGINLYSYANQNPITSVDPKGLEVSPMHDDLFFEPKPSPGVVSLEMHALRGVGIKIVTCCGNDGKLLQHTYAKRCVGASVGAGISISLPEISKSTCSNPPKEIKHGQELGVSIGLFSAEHGARLVRKIYPSG